MKTIIFDFDGTLTKRNNEIWRNIWVKLDAGDIDDLLFEKCKNGEISVEEWIEEVEQEFVKRKLDKTTLDLLIQNINLMDNLEYTLNKLKRDGYKLCILSGGIDYVIKYLLKDKYNLFDDVQCSKFIFDDKGYLKNIINTKYDMEGKALYIKEYIEKNKCSPSDIIFIGNGSNDEYAFQSGCHTICINPSNTNHLNKDIWNLYIENSEDLKDILKIIENIK